ncbi:MAG: CerR family C-terminal domain-containing protein [Massilia sp.]
MTRIVEETRKTRSDGVQSRERLLLAAMRLFAEQGFATTSTREIALAAGANIASISYYFGDKAGLYRAAFNELAQCRGKPLVACADPQATLRDSLHAFYTMLLDPLKQGDLAHLRLRLWFREMLEPTGLWREEIDNGIKPAHAHLVLLLGRHMGIAEPGDDIARLAFGIVALAVQMMVNRDVIDEVAPQLLANDDAIDTWMVRLVDYAEAMVHAEQARLARACQITARTIADKTDKKPLSRKKPA